MRYTDNLELPIIEDADAFGSLFTVNNETNQKLEESFGNIPHFQQSVEQMQGNVNKLTQDVNVLKANENDIKRRVIVLEDLKNKVNIMVSGTERTGTHHRVKLTVKPNTTVNLARVPLYNNDTETLYIRNYTASLAINMRDVFGITNIDNIIMLGVGTYQTSYIYQGRTNVIPLHLKAMGEHPSNKDLTMFLQGSYLDTIKSPVGTTSSVGAYEQTGDVELVIEYVKLD